MKIGEIKGMLIPGKFESRVPNWIYRDPQGWVTTKFLTATVSDLLHGWQIYKTGQAGRLQSTFPVPDVTLFISVNAICSHSTTIVLLLSVWVLQELLLHAVSAWTQARVWQQCTWQRGGRLAKFSYIYWQAGYPPQLQEPLNTGHYSQGTAAV